MLIGLLQAWGGGFYLTNKILFALSEDKTGQLKRRLKIIGWIIYILGVPAWVIILVGDNNWIAASIEAGGIPAMLLGLRNSIKKEKVHKLVNTCVAILTYASLIFGIYISIKYNHGISSLSQILELGVMLGFLLGSYAIAKENISGWFFFMLMNLSMATLMLIQNKPILMAQQLVSLYFVIYGYIKSYRNSKS